jgi:hypothetical protein
MITERVMPIAMFLLLIMIGINGFIVVAGGLGTGEVDALNNPVLDAQGNVIKLNTRIGGNIDSLSGDINKTVSSITYSPTGQANASTTTSSAFSIFTAEFWIGGAKKLISGVGESLIGVNGMNMMDNAINGIEIYMDQYIKWFPDFAAIFLAIKYLCLTIKGIALIYVGSIAVRLITGRGVF